MFNKKEKDKVKISMVEWKLRSVKLGFLGYFFLAFEQGSNVDWFLFGRLLILG